MRLLKLSALIIMMGTLLSGKAVFSQEGATIKIGYVDFDEVVRQYYKTQLYQQKLQAEASDEEIVLKGKIDEINRIKQEMELLSDEAKTEKEKLLNMKIAEAQGRRDQTKRDFQRKAINTMNEIFNEIYKEIEIQGKAGGYTFIFRKKVATPAIDQPLVLYGDEKYDLTEKIIEELNKSQPKDKTTDDESSLQEEIEQEMPESLITE